MALGNFLLKIPPATPQELSKPKSLQSTGTAKPKQGDLTADLNRTHILPMLKEKLFKTVKITGHNQNQENHNLNAKI